jgi:RHS repeat-associated protein
VPVGAYESPSATEAVAVTVAATGATVAGELTVWSGDGPAPAEATTLAYGAGGLASNTTTVAYPADGSLAIEATSDVSVVITVSGYWLEGRRDASFSYDPDGLRQSKTTHAGTTVFGWDHASGLPLLLEEQGPEGRTRYLYGPGGMPIAQQDPDGRVLHLHADQLGSVRAATNAADGATVTTRTFDPWGTVQATGETTATPFGCAGEYTDVETGLVYLRARYYDPSTGNFLTRDPIETITREPYGYVGGDPLNATDPSGLCWGPICTPGEYAEGARDLLGICSDYVDPSCTSVAEANPETAQGIVDFSSGVLDVNPITATLNGLGLSDTGQYANDCSGWFRGGQVSMLVVDLVAGGGMVGLSVKPFRYANAGGGGVALLRNGSQIVRADYHLVKVRQSFRFLPRTWVGERHMLPHLHFSGSGRHWPWQTVRPR